jgi:hypothetical protein
MSTPHLAEDEQPSPTYDYREVDGTWMIYDRRSGDTAVLNGILQAGLELNEADELTSVLNRVEKFRSFARRSARD